MNPETNRIEYKQQLIDDLEKEAIAFLNYYDVGMTFGSLPQGMTESEFFEGYSVPRNKELMRIFRDLDLVEHLGSGVPRILRSYGKECLMFTENFLRMTFPASEQVTEQVTEQVAEQVAEQVGIKLGLSREQVFLLLSHYSTPQDIKSLMFKMGLSNRTKFKEKYINPLLKEGFLEMTIPDKPNSSLQKYRLTILGKQLKEKL